MSKLKLVGNHVTMRELWHYLGKNHSSQPILALSEEESYASNILFLPKEEEGFTMRTNPPKYTQIIIPVVGVVSLEPPRLYRQERRIDLNFEYDGKVEALVRILRSALSELPYNASRPDCVSKIDLKKRAFFLDELYVGDSLAGILAERWSAYGPKTIIEG